MVTYSDGSCYRGHHNGGKRHGRGTLCYGPGPVLSSQPYDGEFLGPAGRCQYEGEWKNDLRDGKGYFFYPDGGRYDGYWKDDMRHGKGTIRLATEYVGTYAYGDGSKYVGNWALDKRMGKGVTR